MGTRQGNPSPLTWSLSRLSYFNLFLITDLFDQGVSISNKFFCYLIDRSHYMKYLLPSTFTMKTINLANYFQLSAITQITFQFLGRSSVLEQKEISFTKMLSVTWTIVSFSSSTRPLNDKQFHYNSLKRRMLHQTNLRFVLFLSGCFNMTPQSISLTQAPYLLNS